MNTYSKYCPNVFLAKCTEMHEKGEVIEMTTKHGKNHDCIVYNLIYQKDGFFYYSIVRADGFNAQQRAAAKAAKYKTFAGNAEKRSNQYFEAANEGRDFLILGEPIKIGHHSEKRHRALIERNWNRIRKAHEELGKAGEYESKADYWENKTNDVNLSMPESIEYYQNILQKAKEHHGGLKNGTIQREHSFSLTYAKKAVNEAEKNLQIALKLWA